MENKMSELRKIGLSYDGEESEASAKKIIFTLFPDWEHDDGEVKFKTFTEGITNTVRCIILIFSTTYLTWIRC